MQIVFVRAAQRGHDRRMCEALYPSANPCFAGDCVEVAGVPTCVCYDGWSKQREVLWNVSLPVERRACLQHDLLLTAVYGWCAAMAAVASSLVGMLLYRRWRRNRLHFKVMVGLGPTGLSVFCMFIFSSWRAVRIHDVALGVDLAYSVIAAVSMAMTFVSTSAMIHRNMLVVGSLLARSKSNKAAHLVKLGLAAAPVMAACALAFSTLGILATLYPAAESALLRANFGMLGIAAAAYALLAVIVISSVLRTVKESIQSQGQDPARARDPDREKRILLASKSIRTHTRFLIIAHIPMVVFGISSLAFPLAFQMMLYYIPFISGLTATAVAMGVFGALRRFALRKPPRATRKRAASPTSQATAATTGTGTGIPFTANMWASARVLQRSPTTKPSPTKSSLALTWKQAKALMGSSARDATRPPLRRPPPPRRAQPRASAAVAPHNLI